jgi:energy-coupling factor transport system substrate-specific component
LARAASAAAIAAAAAAAAWTVLDPGDAALSLLLVAGALVAAGAAWFETSSDGPGELAAVAVLGGVAAAGRVLLAVIPGVQPVTVIATASGAALGARAGFGVGATAALVSNVFRGQGPWTPWQMLLWGLCGAAGAWAAPFIRGRVPFAIFCGVLGLAFSLVMDLWNWFSFYPHTWASLSVVLARGLWFDVAHAGGNVLIALVVGPELRRLLERYRRRLRAEVQWA